jgi:glycosyltransferase involved in cell wall biosynthesis
VRIHAIIPAFNEAHTIGTVVSRLRAHVDRVIVVDDGSSDATGRAAREAGAEVVTHPRNLGKGSAVRSGLAAALTPECTHVLFFDADLQHLPEEVPVMIEAAEQSGADLVIGARRFDKQAMPRSRYYANRLGSRVLSWLIGAPVDDTQSGFRLFRASALRTMTLDARGYEVETEMLVKLRRQDGSVTSVPVTAVYASGASKLRPVRDTTRTCFLAVYYRFLERRG